MKVYQVWYCCFEDTGSLGYFATKAMAEQCLLEGEVKVGVWINGDQVQAIGISEIEIQGVD